MQRTEYNGFVSIYWVPGERLKESINSVYLLLPCALPALWNSCSVGLAEGEIPQGEP